MSYCGTSKKKRARNWPLIVSWTEENRATYETPRCNMQPSGLRNFLTQCHIYINESSIFSFRRSWTQWAGHDTDRADTRTHTVLIIPTNLGKCHISVPSSAECNGELSRSCTIRVVMVEIRAIITIRRRTTTTSHISQKYSLQPCFPVPHFLHHFGGNPTGNAAPPSWLFSFMLPVPAKWLITGRAAWWGHLTLVSLNGEGAADLRDTAHKVAKSDRDSASRSVRTIGHKFRSVSCVTANLYQGDTRDEMAQVTV